MCEGGECRSSTREHESPGGGGAGRPGAPRLYSHHRAQSESGRINCRSSVNHTHSAVHSRARPLKIDDGSRGPLSVRMGAGSVLCF